MNFENLLNFSWVSDPSAWIGLVTLIALEIVLGIDNIVFISILSGRLPKEEQEKGRKLGITLAVIPRLVLLLFIGFVLGLEKPVVTIPVVNVGLSWKDIIVAVGGLFLIYKATKEIHGKLEGEEEHGADGDAKKQQAFATVMGEIMLLNVVFSLDSIITAIGMIPREQILVMMIAVIVATIVMAVSINPVSKFVEKHPTVKILALSFLLLIGTTLLAEGFHVKIPKGYVYFAMGFSVVVEMLNLRLKKVSPSVSLREPHMPDDEPATSLPSAAPTTAPPPSAS
ncbi:MAG: TerC family protein [Armatimonadetes bacterium]|nr:TerC family protein [Armatimonadota bacterium]